ncbi:MAG: hypothetical protein KBA53_02305 [Thermoclostridium sp.]|nr:hypothetical protein [Thermoclostridium sp.]
MDDDSKGFIGIYGLNQNKHFLSGTPLNQTILSSSRHAAKSKPVTDEKYHAFVSNPAAGKCR